MFLNFTCYWNHFILALILFVCFRSTISIFLFGSLSSWFLCLLITTLIFFLIIFFLNQLLRGRGGHWWLEGVHGGSLWVWWSLEFKGITATEWPGRAPGGEVYVHACLCVCVCVRSCWGVPDQLISILSPLIPPLGPSSRAPRCRGQIPTFFSPPLDIKCLSVPRPPPPLASPPALYLHQHCVTCVARCCHCSWQTVVAQQRDPLLDKPFEIVLLGLLITPIPLGASLHESGFVSVRPLSTRVSSPNTREIQRFCSRWNRDPMNNCSVD